jgi:hypothetical protein
MFGSATAFAKYYPNVTKHIQLDKSCFGYMAAYIGSDEMLPHRGPQALTAGELSAIWLKHLTGREFQDREEFNNWFDANQEYLKWNQETGKFEIHRPQTFPAVEIPKRSEPHMQCKNHRGAIGEAGVEAQLGSAAIYAAPIWCIWGRRAVIL